MNIPTFITECMVRGIHFKLSDGVLEVSGNPKLITLDFIERHKPEIIRELSRPAWAEGCHEVIENGEVIGYRIAPREKEDEK